MLYIYNGVLFNQREELSVISRKTHYLIFKSLTFSVEPTTARLCILSDTHHFLRTSFLHNPLKLPFILFAEFWSQLVFYVLWALFTRDGHAEMNTCSPITLFSKDCHYSQVFLTSMVREMCACVCELYMHSNIYIHTNVYTYSYSTLHWAQIYLRRQKTQ